MDVPWEKNLFFIFERDFILESSAQIMLAKQKVNLKKKKKRGNEILVNSGTILKFENIFGIFTYNMIH